MARIRRVLQGWHPRRYRLLDQSSANAPSTSPIQIDVISKDLTKALGNWSCERCR